MHLPIATVREEKSGLENFMKESLLKKDTKGLYPDLTERIWCDQDVSKQLEFLYKKSKEPSNQKIFT